MSCPSLPNNYMYPGALFKAEKKQCDDVINMADQGTAILVIVRHTNIYVSAVLG